jgi:two-component system, NarL family, sensor histidine kinase DevS
LQTVLRRVVEAAVELVDARYGALGVLDESRNHLVEFITVGLDDSIREAIGALPKGLGLLGSIIRDAQPLRLVDLHEHDDSVGFPPHHPPMTSFLGVPIRIRDQVFGNLYLTDKISAEVFTDVDEELALGLASAAAVAIDNARLFEQVRQRGAMLAAIHEVSAALLSGAESSDSLRLLARRARELVEGDLATIALVDDDGRLVVEVADGPLADEFAGLVFGPAGTVSGEVIRTGRTVTLEDVSGDDRRGQPQVVDGRIGAAVWTPLVTAGRPFGSLSVARLVGKTSFSPAELDVVGSFATQASVIFEHDRARQELQRLNVLEDHERIARDLHDTVIQRLFATGMSLQGVTRGITAPALRERVGAAIDDLDVTIRQIRTVIFELEEPLSAARPTLRAWALELAHEAGRMLGFEPRVSFEGPLDTVLGEAPANHVLATLREALSNVARHASAERVDVDLRILDDRVQLIVRDDGRGLDPEAATGAGRGLSNMRARAERHGGTLGIESAPGQGTTLTWSLPIPHLT